MYMIWHKKLKGGEKMKKECLECQDENLMRIAELELENQNLQDWRFRLEQCLENEHEIERLLRAEIETLQNKLRIYQKHCLNIKEGK